MIEDFNKSATRIGKELPLRQRIIRFWFYYPGVIVSLCFVLICSCILWLVIKVTAQDDPFAD